TRLLGNFETWCEENADADSPNARLFSTLFLLRRQTGKLELRGLSTAGSEADRLIESHLAALTDGTGAPCTRATADTPWLECALNPCPELFGAVSKGALFKGKDAFLRRRHTDRQMKVAYHYLTRSDCDVPGGMFGLVTYGGRVNTIAPDATAT